MSPEASPFYFYFYLIKIINKNKNTGPPGYVAIIKILILIKGFNLYYHAKSQIDLKRVLKIHVNTCKKYIDTKIPYLNNFLLLSYPIPTALSSNITVKELVDIMQKERRAMYVLGTRRNIPVTL